MKQAKTPAIVTRESLRDMLEAATFEKQMHIVGRALVVLFNRQTAGEQSANSTDQDNSIGFASADARGGCLSAKSYIKRHALESWQVAKWTAPAKNGFPKLCKYHRQLNEAAVERAMREGKAVGQAAMLA